jgi:hypothetical protein
MSHLLLNLRQDTTRPSSDNDLTASQPSSGICRFRKYALGLGGRVGGTTSFFESRGGGGNTTGTGLMFTTRILGNLTAEYRDGGSWEEEEWKEVSGVEGRGQQWRRSRGGTSESGSGELRGGVEEMELQERVRTRDRGQSQNRRTLTREAELTLDVRDLPRDQGYLRVEHPSQPHSPETLLSPSSTLVASTPLSTEPSSSASLLERPVTRERVLRSDLGEGSSSLGNSQS